MAGDPRVEIRPGEYPRIRYWDGDREWYLYLHRCTAFAHGIIDDLFDGAPIHHVDHDKLNNRPENLTAIPGVDHSRYHAKHNHENGKW